LVLPVANGLTLPVQNYNEFKTQRHTVTRQHPITVPLDLVRDWQRDANHNEAMFPQVANRAAEWGYALAQKELRGGLLGGLLAVGGGFASQTGRWLRHLLGFRGRLAAVPDLAGDGDEAHCGDRKPE
jgi:hypothetical protein